MFSTKGKIDSFSQNNLFDDSLLAEFKRNIVRLGIKKGNRLLIGFSGGPDSTLLLYFISILYRELNLFPYGLYIDHGIRDVDEIEREISFVENSYKRFGIEGFIEKIPRGEIKRVAREEGRSIEEVAREKRYEIYYRYVYRLNIDHLLLGHNLDDNVETILMRFLSGSGIHGLAGVPESNGIIKRPLYTFPKSIILEYLERKGLKFSLDSTNLKNDYFRNIVRNQLLPQIEKYIPDVKSRLLGISGRVRLFKDFLDWNFGEKGYIEVCKDGFKIDGAWFISLPAILRVEIFYSLLNRYNSEPSSETIPYGFLKPLICKEDLQRRKVVLKGHGVRLEWVGNELFWRGNIVDNAKKGYLIKLRNNGSYSINLLREKLGIDKIEISNLGRMGKARKGPFGIRVEEKGNVLTINGCFKPPLFIRSKRDGDWIRISNGRRTLKKVLLEMGIKGNERVKVPLLCDRDGIAVIMGGILGYNYKLRKNYNRMARGISLFKIKLTLIGKG